MQGAREPRSMQLLRCDRGGSPTLDSAPCSRDSDSALPTRGPRGVLPSPPNSKYPHSRHTRSALPGQRPDVPFLRPEHKLFHPFCLAHCRTTRCRPSDTSSSPTDSHAASPTAERQGILTQRPMITYPNSTDSHAASPTAERQGAPTPRQRRTFASPTDSHSASPTGESSDILLVQPESM